jgi:hypothetical protein
LITIYYQGVFDAPGVIEIGVTLRPQLTKELLPFFSMSRKANTM